MADIQLVGQQVEQTVRWVVVGLGAVCLVILKRWFDKTLEALERIPDAQWFKDVKTQMDALAHDHETRITVLEDRRRDERRRASLKVSQ